MLRIVLSILIALPLLTLMSTDGSGEQRPLNFEGFSEWMLGQEAQGWRGMDEKRIHRARIGGRIHGAFVDRTPSLDELEERLSGKDRLGVSIELDLAPPIMSQIEAAERSLEAGAKPSENTRIVLVQGADIRVLPMGEP